MNYASESELTSAIENAVQLAIEKLFAEYADHHFYYITLFTSGLATTPYLAAWSHESLDGALRNSTDRERDRELMEWSYAESPFLGYGEEYFQEVARLFNECRPVINRLHGNVQEAEYELRLRAMETAIANLDRRGIFGEGERRNQLFIAVEVVPPDWTNTERAQRLNAPDSEILRRWLKEAAE